MNNLSFRGICKAILIDAAEYFLAVARVMAMYLCRSLRGEKLTEIGGLDANTKKGPHFDFDLIPLFHSLKHG